MYSKRGEVVFNCIAGSLRVQVGAGSGMWCASLLMSLDVSCMTTGTELAVEELIVMIYDRGC